MNTLHALKDWLAAGMPPHYLWLIFVLYYIDVQVMPKTQWKSNSIVEALMNQLNKVLLPILSKVPIFGTLLAAMDTPATTGPGPTAAELAEREEGKKVQLPPVIRPGLLLPFLLIGAVGVQGCVHGPTPVPTPSTQQYEQAFGSCMAAAGINDATGLGEKILAILATPGLTQTEITQRIEALGIPAAGTALANTAICAITAFTNINPIKAGEKPTPAQAAVRVFLARHARPIGMVR